MKYHLKDFNRNVTDIDLLDDLKKVAAKLGSNKLSTRDYDSNGARYTSGTICRRFISWNNALEKAGLNLVQQRDVSLEELFRNLEEVWINLGRPPVFRDIKSPLSLYSTHHYITKFGTWRKALEAFVEFINSDHNQNQEIDENGTDEKNSVVDREAEIIFKHKTKRNPSDRLKVQVLMRDGNKCKLCGITVEGNSIHFDHIKPWSKGGETVLENLQVLCSKHNMAKGNLEYGGNEVSD